MKKVTVMVGIGPAEDGVEGVNIHIQEWDQPCSEAVLSPKEARAFAILMIELADEIDAQNKP